MRITFHGEVVAINEGIYNVIVFKNLEVENKHYYRFITITIPPNWKHKILKRGDKGYVEYEAVYGGDEYFKCSEGIKKQYNYSQYYFIGFVSEQDKSENTEFKV